MASKIPISAPPGSLGREDTDGDGRAGHPYTACKYSCPLLFALPVSRRLLRLVIELTIHPAIPPGPQPRMCRSVTGGLASDAKAPYLRTRPLGFWQGVGLLRRVPESLRDAHVPAEEGSLA